MVAVCPNPTKLAIDNWVVVKDPIALVDDWPVNNAGVILSIVKDPNDVDAETPTISRTGLDERCANKILTGLKRYPDFKWNI